METYAKVSTKLELESERIGNNNLDTMTLQKAGALLKPVSKDDLKPSLEKLNKTSDPVSAIENISEPETMLKKQTTFQPDTLKEHKQSKVDITQNLVAYNISYDPDNLIEQNTLNLAETLIEIDQYEVQEGSSFTQNLIFQMDENSEIGSGEEDDFEENLNNYYSIESQSQEDNYEQGSGYRQEMKTNMINANVTIFNIPDEELVEGSMPEESLEMNDIQDKSEMNMKTINGNGSSNRDKAVNSIAEITEAQFLPDTSNREENTQNAAASDGELETFTKMRNEPRNLKFL